MTQSKRNKSANGQDTSKPPRAVLLTVPNHHQRTDGGTNYPPDFNPDDDFVAYMPNRHGEQMVFVQKRGIGIADLWHGDYAWQYVGVVNGATALNLSPEEQLFIDACWLASEWWRESPD